MTTIVDPSGSPSVVYNRSGTTIIPVTASGTTQGAATEIPNISGEQVIMVTVSSGSHYAVKLNASADIGTVVEVYQASGPVAFHVFAPTSQSINGDTGADITGIGVRFRKVASTDWRVLLSAQ